MQSFQELENAANFLNAYLSAKICFDTEEYTIFDTAEDEPAKN